MNEKSALTPISRSPVQENESIHTAPISVEWTTSPIVGDSDREKRLQEKYGIQPQTGLRERGLRFNDPEKGPAWAVEAYIPVTDELRKSLKIHGDFNLPENITGIVYVDLSPQESIYPVKHRTIRTAWQTKFRFAVRGPLDQLRAASTKDTLSEFFAFLESMNLSTAKTTPEQKKANVFGVMFKNIFKDRKQKQEQFSALLEKSPAKNLVIIHGHGGGEKEHVMGEQNPDAVMNGEEIVQRSGNRIFTSEIIDLYDHPEEYAALVFSACNMEGAKIAVKNVPIVHPLGPSGLEGGPLDWLPSQKNKAYIIVPTLYREAKP